MRRISFVMLSIFVVLVAGLVPASAQRAPEPGLRAARSVVGSTTTVTYEAFIPRARIDAPTMLGKAVCDYGKGYQFGGDGHSAFDWTSPNYRVALHAVIDWKAEKVTGYKSVRPTIVYRKSTGRLVAQKTATSKYMTAKALGFGSRAGSRYADVRMVVQATNPFCQGILGVKGAINGALTIRLYKNGWWEIRSGTVRRMPNTYIYIYNRGHVADVLKEKYASPLCLVGMSGAWGCDELKLTGYTGEFS